MSTYSVHVNALNLGQDIPTSENYPSDPGHIIPPPEKCAPDLDEEKPTTEKYASDSGQNILPSEYYPSDLGHIILIPEYLLPVFRQGFQFFVAKVFYFCHSISNSRALLIYGHWEESPRLVALTVQILPYNAQAILYCHTYWQEHTSFV